jgi:hypothetical protein
MLSKGLLLLGEDSNHEGDKICQKGATKMHTAMITPGETYILYTNFNLHKQHVQQLVLFFHSKLWIKANLTDICGAIEMWKCLKFH